MKHRGDSRSDNRCETAKLRRRAERDRKRVDAEADREDEAELRLINTLSDGAIGRDPVARAHLAGLVGEVWARMTVRSIERALDAPRRRRRGGTRTEAG